MQANMECQILRLDGVCMHAIFSFLPARSLASAACVSRDWRDVVLDDALWELACAQSDGDVYRRNSAAQLADIATGAPTPPHPTPPDPTPHGAV